MLNVKKHDYTINQKAQEKLKKLFENAIENKDENFGNARYVRNIFEKTLENQAMRLASLTNLSKEILSEITKWIFLSPNKKHIYKKRQKRTFSVTCPTTPDDSLIASILPRTEKVRFLFVFSPSRLSIYLDYKPMLFFYGKGTHRHSYTCS